MILSIILKNGLPQKNRKKFKNVENIVIIKIKKIGKDAKLPQKQKEGDVGFDAYICSFKGISNNGNLFDYNEKEVNLSSLFRVACRLGFATEIPKGYYAQVVPRSGLALREGITILNTPGTIDSGYRNEWMAIIVNISNKQVKLKVGDRICQIIFRKCVDVEFEEVKELNKSERGLDGLGSTGKIL